MHCTKHKGTKKIFAQKNISNYLNKYSSEHNRYIFYAHNYILMPPYID
jgi:hypothetical protein